MEMAGTCNISWPAVAHTEGLRSKLKTAKVLAVGAGGIGCELLKTLVLTGFENIEVIDMDTIETSNLNRQFLFRKRHVGESKAAVAAQAVTQFRPSARIKAHQANIKEAQYGVDFFKSFDIVLNGLDNLEARRHVNRLCLTARTPLIESGTAGYLGQVTVHLRLTNERDEVVSSSECFECQPKAAPKSYPVCTIRNTPDKPIHCVVWAKDLLFQRLFGSPEVVTDLDEKTKEEEAAQTDGAEKDDPSDFLQRKGESAETYARRIFERVFCRDIEKVLSMEDLWKARKRPTPLRLGEIMEQTLPEAQAVTAAGPTTTASQALGLSDHHKMWTVRENTQVEQDAVTKLQPYQAAVKERKVFLKAVRLFLETRREDAGAAVFDKDDDLAVEFVTAASNLRALSYDIPTQSLFDAKGMAGNIIHAIATTNAVIAGMIVIEAMKVLAGMPEACKMSYLQQIPSGKRLITAMALSEPNPDCVVCGTSQLQVSCNTAETTLSAFIDKVLKKRLAMNEPTVLCDGFAYEEGADLEPDEVAANQKLLPVALDKLPGGGIKHGSIVSVNDQAQDFSCQLVVSNKAEWDEEKEPDGFTLTGTVREAEKPAANGNVAGPFATAMEQDDDDDFEIVEEASGSAGGSKRKREADDAALEPSKRPATRKDEGSAIMLD